MKYHALDYGTPSRAMVKKLNTYSESDILQLTEIQYMKSSSGNLESLGLNIKCDPIAAGLVAQYKCWCYDCLAKIRDSNGLPVTMSTFIVCPDCGNKRCPRATDHDLDCTNLNDSGQKGSRYE